MKRNYFLLFFVALGVSSCGLEKRVPFVSMEEQKVEFQAIALDTTEKRVSNYKSLGFGDLKVYKPYSFFQLDSVYAIKDNYIQTNDYRGMRVSGIDGVIETFKAQAEEDLPLVQYEMEHLYQSVMSPDSVRIAHAFYLFGHDHRLISITPFYHFEVSNQQLDLFYAYQFNQHFITERDLIISKAELDFINYYKDREFELIGEPGLQHFMDYTLSLMKAAQTIHSVDYRNLAKAIAINNVLQIHPSASIEEAHELMVSKTGEHIDYYSIKIDWSENFGQSAKTSEYLFSPYLELTDVIETER